MSSKNHQHLIKNESKDTIYRTSHKMIKVVERKKSPKNEEHARKLTIIPMKSLTEEKNSKRKYHRGQKRIHQYNLSDAIYCLSSSGRLTISCEINCWLAFDIEVCLSLLICIWSNELSERLRIWECPSTIIIIAIIVIIPSI